MKVKLYNDELWWQWGFYDTMYSDVDRYVVWIKRLPLTKRGSRAYLYQICIV